MEENGMQILCVWEMGPLGNNADWAPKNMLGSKLEMLALSNCPVQA